MSWEQAVLRLRNDPNQMELVKACFYDDPLPEAAMRYVRSSEWAALQKLLPVPVGRALDIGAGRGIVSFALARAGWRVTAVEPDKSYIVGAGAIRTLAESTDTHIEVLESCGESLSCSSNSFELVHCRAVLHHAADLSRFCNEVARVLAPGGMFIATRDHVITNDSDRELFLKLHPLHRLFGGENAYVLSSYIAAIERSGLQIQRVLNPFESDINLFPGTLTEFKVRIAKRIGLRNHRYIPTKLLGWLGRFDNTPGRLFTFIASKSTIPT
jgi:SAM-dependent methyltransferase